MTETKAVRLRITGHVQGVWFRGWTVENATRLGLFGFVRNRKDGAVEIVLKGEPAAVDEMVRLCRSGPPAARVDGIEISAAKGLVPARFDQKPTV